MDRHKIGVLVINQNRKQDITELGDSLRHHESLDVEVFVLDNNCSPSESTRQWMEKSQLRITREVSDELLTRVAGYNLLMAKAKLSGCSWVWLLDAEMRVLKGAWRQVGQMIKNEGVIGGGGVEGRNGKKFRGASGGWRGLDLKRLEVGPRRGDNNWHDCAWVEIGNLLAPIDAFEKIGGFDT